MPVRAASATTVLLAGATGALGGELLARLTRRGHEVIFLVRAKNGFPAQQRLNPLLRANSRMDEDYLGRLLNYAASAEWGRAGFPPPRLDRRDVPKRRAYGLQLPHLRFD